MKKLIFSFALLFTAFSGVATAQSPAGIAVNHADLNLASVEGVETLDARLAHAVRQACGFDKDERVLAQSVAQRRCLAAKHAEIAASRSAAIAAANTASRTLAAR
jgi:UrcA family protein